MKRKIPRPLRHAVIIIQLLGYAPGNFDFIQKIWGGFVSQVRALENFKSFRSVQCYFSSTEDNQCVKTELLIFLKDSQLTDALKCDEQREKEPGIVH